MEGRSRLPSSPTDTNSCEIGRREWEGARRQSGHADRSAPAQAEIGERRASKGASEHQREGGRVLIAEVNRNCRDGFARCEPRQRAKQASLLPPGHKTHGRLAPEQAREGPAAHAERVGPLVDRLVNAGLLNEAATMRRQGSVRRIAKREGQYGQFLQLIVYKLHQ